MKFNTDLHEKQAIRNYNSKISNLENSLASVFHDKDNKKSCAQKKK